MATEEERAQVAEKKKIKPQPVVSTSFDPDAVPLRRPGITVLDKAKRVPRPRRGE